MQKEGISIRRSEGKAASVWKDINKAIGYNLYYDQADKVQLVTGLATTTYTDSGLTNGQQYCYVVTSYNDVCESAYSDVVCATPTNQRTATVPTVETGTYSGNGNNASFVASASFQAGDDIIVRATVVDGSGQPVQGAIVELTIDGPEQVILTTGHSDAAGLAEAIWKTAAPRGNNTGTTPGSYSATVSNVTLDGTSWDGTPTAASFTIQ